MILIGFTCTGTFQLWLNCAQNFAKENVGWANPSIMQTYYSAGTMLALVVTAFLTRKIKDVRFIVVYPAICLVTMIAVLMGQSKPLMIAGAFIIGWAGAGGLLQIATSVCNMLFPKIKGTVTALVMIASSLCNYTILTAASKMQPSGVMTMNIVLTAVGVALGLFVNIRYKKWLNLHSRTIKMRLRIAEVRSTKESGREKKSLQRKVRVKLKKEGKTHEYSKSS